MRVDVNAELRARVDALLGRATCAWWPRPPAEPEQPSPRPWRRRQLAGSVGARDSAAVDKPSLPDATGRPVPAAITQPRPQNTLPKPRFSSLSRLISPDRAAPIPVTESAGFGCFGETGRISIKGVRHPSGDGLSLVSMKRFHSCFVPRFTEWKRLRNTSCLERLACLAVPIALLSWRCVVCVLRGPCWFVRRPSVADQRGGNVSGANGVLIDAQGVLRLQHFPDPNGQLAKKRIAEARAHLNPDVAKASSCARCRSIGWKPRCATTGQGPAAHRRDGAAWPD